MTENGNGDTEELRFPTTFLEKKKKKQQKKPSRCMERFPKSIGNIYLPASLIIIIINLYFMPPDLTPKHGFSS